MNLSLLVRLASGLVLAGLLVTGIVGVRVWPHAIGAGLETAVRTTRDLGSAGWLVAALAQILIALCGVLPASVGGLVAGALYGIGTGFLLSGLGTLVGAALAFVLARSLFRPLVVRALRHRPRLAQFDEAVSRDGWRTVCLLRISPVMPFAVTSYALGITSLSLRNYMIGTLAALPALLGTVVLGHLAGVGLDTARGSGARPLHWALLALAIVATAVLTLRLGRIAALVMRLPATAVTAVRGAARPGLAEAGAEPVSLRGHG